MSGLSPHAKAVLDEMPLIAKKRLGLVEVKTVNTGVTIIEDFLKILKENRMETSATVNIALERYLRELGLLKKT